MKPQPLKVTEVEIQATPGLEPKTSAATYFIGLVRERRAWIMATLLLGMIVILEPFVLMRFFNREEKAIILDPSGTYYISPIISFQNATEIQKNIGNLATQCLFCQNPSGYDLQHIIDDLFIGPAKEKILKDWEEQEASFREKELHQKPEIFRTTVLKAEGDFILVKIEGQVIRTGMFEGTTLVHSQNMEVHFVLSKNPNLIKSGNYPFIVCNFKSLFL